MTLLRTTRSLSKRETALRRSLLNLKTGGWVKMCTGMLDYSLVRTLSASLLKFVLITLSKQIMLRCRNDRETYVSRGIMQESRGKWRKAGSCLRRKETLASDILGEGYVSHDIQISQFLIIECISWLSLQSGAAMLTSASTRACMTRRGLRSKKSQSPFYDC